MFMLGELCSMKAELCVSRLPLQMLDGLLKFPVQAQLQSAQSLLTVAFLILH